MSKIQKHLQNKLFQLHNKKGFSLLELIIVVAIIAILVIMAVASFGGSSERANKARVMSDMDVIATAEQKYYADNTAWSGTANTLTKDNIKSYCASMGRYIYRCPVVPDADGRFVITRNKAGFNVVYSAPSKGTNISIK